MTDAPTCSCVWQGDKVVSFCGAHHQLHREMAADLKERISQLERASSLCGQPECPRCKFYVRVIERLVGGND